MTPETQAAALQYAIERLPFEACGLVVLVDGKEVFRPCRNESEKQDQFVMSAEDYAAAEDVGEVVAVVHSHPNASSRASQADLVGCEVSGLPWHIVSVPGGIWSSIRPSGYKAPLVGRTFAHGILDCFTLVRDWYSEEMGIEIADYEREFEWWLKGEDLYVRNYEKEGFVPVTDGSLERGDAILMRIRSLVPNHAAVYLGDNVILQHLQGRLSARAIYGGMWAKYTALVLRYRRAA